MMKAESLTVVVETPKGSTEKYDYDQEKHFLKLKKILPAGMVFPYDFGFIPNTKGEDGDPLDVIIISEFKSFPGCRMECRIVGAILAEQKEKKEKEKVRNDRYIGICSLSSTFKNVNEIEELPSQITDDLQNFFVNYNALEGKTFSPIKIIKSKKAYELINSYTNEQH